MAQDQNKKSLRSFQCRDYLWEIFEQMSGELECSVDYLINEAMRQYARSRNYAGRSPSQPGMPRPSAPPPSAGIPSLGQPSQGRPPIPSAPPPPPQRPAQPPGYGAPAQPPGYGAPAAQPPGYGAPQQAPQYGAPPQAPQYNAPPHQAPRAPSYPQMPQAAPAYPPAPGYGALPPAPRPVSQPPGAATNRPPPMPGHAPPPLPSAPRPSAPMAGYAPGGPRPTLYVIFNGQKMPVNKDEFVIGRGSKSADLPIKDGNISRRHAAVVFQNGGWYMKDLGSTNGIEYNGARIDTKLIAEGDMIQICDYELRFTYH